MFFWILQGFIQHLSSLSVCRIIPWKCEQASNTDSPWQHRQKESVWKRKKAVLFCPSGLLSTERAQISFRLVGHFRRYCTSDFRLFSFERLAQEQKAKKERIKTLPPWEQLLQVWVSERRWDVRGKKGILMEGFILYVFTCSGRASGNKAIMLVVVWSWEMQSNILETGSHSAQTPCCLTLCFRLPY